MQLEVHSKGALALCISRFTHKSKGNKLKYLPKERSNKKGKPKNKRGVVTILFRKVSDGDEGQEL